MGGQKSPKEKSCHRVKSDDNFEESFKFVLPGYNLRPLEMSGAIGLEQMKKLVELFQAEEKCKDISRTNV